VLLGLVPVLMGAVLVVRQRRGSLKKSERVLGEVFVDYRPSVVFWESVLLLRRLVLLAVFVPTVTAYGPQAAKSALLITLSLFLVLQLFVLPYRHWLDNTLEAFSIGAVVVMVGLFALKSPLSVKLGSAVLITSCVVLLTGKAMQICALVVRVGRTAVDQLREQLSAQHGRTETSTTVLSAPNDSLQERLLSDGQL